MCVCVCLCVCVRVCAAVYTSISKCAFLCVCVFCRRRDEGGGMKREFLIRGRIWGGRVSVRGRGKEGNGGTQIQHKK